VSVAGVVKGGVVEGAEGVDEWIAGFGAGSATRFGARFGAQSGARFGDGSLTRSSFQFGGSSYGGRPDEGSAGVGVYGVAGLGVTPSLVNVGGGGGAVCVINGAGGCAYDCLDAGASP
jgi:hypothetical protein